MAGGCRVILAAVAALAVQPAMAEEGETPAWQLDLVYTGEFWRNTTGGLQEGGVYVDNLDMALTIDGGRAFGLEGLTLFAYGLYNNGNELTGRYVGDVQVISNIETGVRATRLFELWADWTFGANDSHSVLFGLMDLNGEFDVIDSSGLFINGARGIGAEIAQAGENGPSIFPFSSLALRYRWQPTDHWAFQAVVMDGVPNDPDHPKRSTLKLRSDEGALLVGEVHYYGDFVRKAALGAWHFTADFEDLLVTDGADDPLERSGNSGFYGFADFNLYREADDPDQGLTGWVRYGVADTDLNPLKSYGSFGFVYTGLVPGRPEDQLGLALAVSRNGNPFLKAAALGGDFLDRRETNIELTYRGAVTDWLTLQPNIQYVRNPGTDPGLDDAFVVGLRFEMGWGWSR
jgi:porin